MFIPDHNCKQNTNTSQIRGSAANQQGSRATSWLIYEVNVTQGACQKQTSALGCPSTTLADGTSYSNIYCASCSSKVSQNAAGTAILQHMNMAVPPAVLPSAASFSLDCLKRNTLTAFSVTDAMCDTPTTACITFLMPVPTCRGEVGDVV